MRPIQAVVLESIIGDGAVLRTSLFAPLAGALLFASPAIGQRDNGPGAYQRNADDRNAQDEEDAQQGTASQERDRYTYQRDGNRDNYRNAYRRDDSYRRDDYRDTDRDAYRRDDYRDTNRDAYRRDDYRDTNRDAYRRNDDRGAARNGDEESESYTVEPDRTESPVARDTYRRERPVAQQRHDLDRQAGDRFIYPPETNRNATEEQASDPPQSDAYPAATVRWDDRAQGADAPTTSRSEPLRPDREQVLPQDEVTPPVGTEGTETTPLTPDRAVGITPSASRSDYSSAEAIWHVRAALNVAALNCRDANEAHTVAAYNGMLSARRETLAAADTQTKALFRARFGEGWQNMHDTAMTKLYNFFARPPAHDDFCQVAEQILDEAQVVPDAAFAAFANDALARLEAPFSDWNRRADAYRASPGIRQGATS
jgi:hypothetical protein